MGLLGVAEGSRAESIEEEKRLKRGPHPAMGRDADVWRDAGDDARRSPPSKSSSTSSTGFHQDDEESQDTGDWVTHLSGHIPPDLYT